MKFNKELEGKIIYAVPTGNNARYAKDKIEKFKVIKVKRKYIEMSQVWEAGDIEKSSCNYCPESGATQTSINQGYGGNAGYDFYLNLEEVENHKNIKKLKKEIKEYFSGYGDLSLTLEQLQSIYKIIKS